MFVFPIGSVTVYIDFDEIISLIVCIVTSVFTSEKHINVVRREVAVPILVLNWICLILYIVCSLWVYYSYLDISRIIPCIIYVPWYAINIIKLNKRKRIPQNIPVIHCDSCGIALPANSVFCTKCGSKITTKDTRGE